MATGGSRTKAKSAAKKPGSVTVTVEVVEDSAERLLLRGWVTRSERWWKAMQYGGSAVALTGLFCAYTAFSIPVVIGGLAAIALGSTSAGVALSQRMRRLRRSRRPWLRRHVDVEWQRPDGAVYRGAGAAGRLLFGGRDLDAHDLQKISMMEMTDDGRDQWTVLLHHAVGVFEPFAPFVGDEDALRVALGRLAARCDATIVEA